MDLRSLSRRLADVGVGRTFDIAVGRSLAQPEEGRHRHIPLDADGYTEKAEMRRRLADVFEWRDA